MQKLRLLAEQNSNIANELFVGNARSLVQLSKDKGIARYKNGSKIESFSMESMRGQRAKVIVIDETRDVDYDLMDAIVSPVRNYRRDISFNYGFSDYSSKAIRISSACEKAKPFYDDFLRITRDMASGRQGSFTCALDYNAAAANEVTAMEFFEDERKKLPDTTFAMEYGSQFIGSTTNSAFPYDLTNTCRTLRKVELEQPKNSKSRYVISLDIATSDAKDADNSIISVLKFVERADGSFARKLVYMRSFHGESLDMLAEEIRKLYHRSFPNTEKIVYDARGLGDSLDRFFDREWIDVLADKEYPPLIVDDVPATNSIGKQMLHPFRAVQSLNQRLYTNLRVALEKRTIELPVSSSILRSIGAQSTIDDEDSDTPRQMTMAEKAIYFEADALQFEMGNIVQIISKNGNVLYDTPSHRWHKDRYSSLAMANDYVSEMEKENIKHHQRGQIVVGLASNF